MSGTYPHLSKMALDMLSILAMSAECERVFSSSKLMVAGGQSRLMEDVIEAGKCLCAWIHGNVI